MYEAFFGLKRRPFAATPDAECFLSSGSIQAALDEIMVCVEQGQGVSVVSGPAGAGKTLLCERLRSELGKQFITVFLRHASFLTRRALLQTILCELNHAYRQQDEQELRLELFPAIRALRPEREALVLICDEAHQLTDDLLEELRILSDLAENGRPLVRLVLVGQLGLEETLALPTLEALSQRIRAQVCLETFNRAGSLDYVDFRLTWAGGRTEEIFSAEALELICQASDGVPRCINQLCDHALLLAYVAEQRPVEAQTIREALQDLRQLPLHWNETGMGKPSQREQSPVEASTETTAINCGSEHNTPPIMESVEIGVDIPSPTSSAIEVGIVDPIPVGSQYSGDEISVKPTDATSLPATSPVICEAVGSTVMIESPNDNPGDAKLTLQFESAELSSASKTEPTCGFVEELVLDRYAAIDAGMEPPELISAGTTLAIEVHATKAPAAEAVSSCDNSAIAERWQSVTLQDSSGLLQPQATREIPSSVESDGDFDEVCERLDELLPQIDEECSWDSESLHDKSVSELLNDWPQTVESSAFDGIETPSLEDRLGAEICQMANDLQRSVGFRTREHSAVEELQSMLTESTDQHHQSGSLASVVEFVDEAVLESKTALRGASECKESSRPYRNLFSMLRRKQQGLL